jgi:hypothetical protein
MILRVDIGAMETTRRDGFSVRPARARLGACVPKLNRHNPFAQIDELQARFGARIAADFRPVFTRFRAGLQLVSPVLGR